MVEALIDDGGCATCTIESVVVAVFSGAGEMLNFSLEIGSESPLGSCGLEFKVRLAAMGWIGPTASGAGAALSMPPFRKAAELFGEELKKLPPTEVGPLNAITLAMPGASRPEIADVESDTAGADIVVDGGTIAVGDSDTVSSQILSRLASFEASKALSSVCCSGVALRFGLARVLFCVLLGELRLFPLQLRGRFDMRWLSPGQCVVRWCRSRLQKAETGRTAPNAPSVERSERAR